MGTQECTAVFIPAAFGNVGIAGDLRLIFEAMDTLLRGVADHPGEFVAGTFHCAKAEFEVDQCGLLSTERAGKHYVYARSNYLSRFSMVSSSGWDYITVLDVT